MSLDNISKRVVDNVLMLNVGLRAVLIIRRRTLSGKYLPGSSPNAEQYSEKPFAMPLGAANKTTLGKIYDLIKSKSSDAPQPFVTKGGNVWVIIKGGSKQMRELGGRDSSKVNFSWTGRTLRNLGVLPGSNTAENVTLGFTSESERLKAVYANIMGAGKSKRKHVFMGLTNEETEQLGIYLGKEVAKNINKALISAWSDGLTS